MTHAHRHWYWICMSCSSTLASYRHWFTYLLTTCHVNFRHDIKTFHIPTVISVIQKYMPFIHVIYVICRCKLNMHNNYFICTTEFWLKSGMNGYIQPLHEIQACNLHVSIMSHWDWRTFVLFFVCSYFLQSHSTCPFVSFFPPSCIHLLNNEFLIGVDDNIHSFNHWLTPWNIKSNLLIMVLIISFNHLFDSMVRCLLLDWSGLQVETESL